MRPATAARPPPRPHRNPHSMRKFGCAALFAACLAIAPAASAGDFFVNGQVGRFDLDTIGFDDGQGDFVQASGGYRWGIGIAQVGLEGGVGKFDELHGQRRSELADGFVDHDYTWDARYGFVGVNARIKPPLLPVYVIGRAGYLGLERTLEQTSVDNTLATPVTTHSRLEQTDGGTYHGVGVGTTILPLLDVSVMYNRYRYSQLDYDAASDEYRLSDDKRDASSVSLSVEYRF